MEAILVLMMNRLFVSSLKKKFQLDRPFALYVVQL